MDALEYPSRDTEPPCQDQIADFLARITRADVQYFEAVAEGKDLRLHGDRIVGGALETDGWVIHLSAFDMPDRGQKQETAHENPRASRIVSLASRRRHRRTN